MIADCLSCQAGMTFDAFCEENPWTEGCPPVEAPEILPQGSPEIQAAAKTAEQAYAAFEQARDHDEKIHATLLDAHHALELAKTEAAAAGAPDSANAAVQAAQDAYNQADLDDQKAHNAME